MDMMTRIIVVFLLIALVACDHKGPLSIRRAGLVCPEVIPIQTKVDTEFIDHFMRVGYPMYIGPRRDTIRFHPMIVVSQIPPPMFYNDSSRPTYKQFGQDYLVDVRDSSMKSARSVDMEIMVDTSRIFWGRFPVYMVNNSKDTVIVSYGRGLDLVVESKRGLGVWADITYYAMYCGTGVKSIMLPPKEIVFTLSPPTSKERKYRLKCGENSSNEFNGAN